MREREAIFRYVSGNCLSPINFVSILFWPLIPLPSQLLCESRQRCYPHSKGPQGTTAQGVEGFCTAAAELCAPSLCRAFLPLWWGQCQQLHLAWQLWQTLTALVPCCTGPKAGDGGTRGPCCQPCHGSWHLQKWGWRGRLAKCCPKKLQCRSWSLPPQPPSASHQP